MRSQSTPWASFARTAEDRPSTPAGRVVGVIEGGGEGIAYLPPATERVITALTLGLDVAPATRRPARSSRRRCDRQLRGRRIAKRSSA